MAEGEQVGGSKHIEESVKLFVGQVPKHITEADLLDMFQEFAVVDEVNIIKDKVTKASRGCCFVICPSREEADKAVDACHNRKTLPGIHRLKLLRNLAPEWASSPLQVKYADGELERLEHKLFVGMLPKNISEAELSDLFSQYGTIKELQILRGSQQTSKGCAFLKYDTKDQALAALEAVNGKHKLEDSNVSLVVKWADTERERLARKAQKSQTRASKLPSDPSQNPSPFGAVQMGYLPPYNGYGYQAPGGYGMMPYRFPPNQSPFQNMVPAGNQGNALHGVRPNIAPAAAQRGFGLPPTGYVGSGYPAVQYPMTYPSGMIAQRPSPGSPGSLHSIVPNSPSTASPDISASSKSHLEGPPGANLFIYHIPQEFGDQDLANSFQQFGRVLSAKVFVDKATGMSKCFGFVSYDSPASAQSAINMMNGFQLGSKKLKVELKRDNKQSNAY